MIHDQLMKKVNVKESLSSGLSIINQSCTANSFQDLIIFRNCTPYVVLRVVDNFCFRPESYKSLKWPTGLGLQALGNERKLPIGLRGLQIKQRYRRLTSIAKI